MVSSKKWSGGLHSGVHCRPVSFSVRRLKFSEMKSCKEVMIKIKHLQLACLALGCLTAFSSCVTFIKPLAIPRKQIGKDVRLIGRWTGKIANKSFEGKREEQVTINVRSKSEREVEISFSGEGFLANFNDVLLLAATATIEHRHYAILRLDDPTSQGYLIARYEINGDQPIIWMVDGQKVEELIKKGELKGIIRTDGFIGIKSMGVTDSARAITRLIKSSSKNDLFLRVGELRRIDSR
jgi:hypothetical protein